MDWEGPLDTYSPADEAIREMDDEVRENIYNEQLERSNDHEQDSLPG